MSRHQGVSDNGIARDLAEITDIAVEAAQECRRATTIHGPINSPHEAYGVIFEELGEYWSEAQKKRQARSPQKMREELIQVAAMAIRTIYDLKLQPGR